MDQSSTCDAMADYMTFYTPERIQGHLGGKTPAEIRAEVLAAETPAQYPIPVNKGIQE